jgi:serine/tyrosine/threonine adenylyltransferase
MEPLSSLKWLHRFITETPGDKQIGGPARQVPGACWSRVIPTPAPSPILRLWSDEIAKTLNLCKDGYETLAGGKPVVGMETYAQRYGGHQFGNWAGQLGDGRAITLGEVETNSGVLELQLKGAGKTPYSRFADGKAVLRSSIREFLCSEAMHHLGVPTTRALSLVTTGEDVMRDMMYDGNREFEPGAVVCRVAPSFIRFGSFQIHGLTGDKETLRTLVEHTIENHFPGCNVESDEGIIQWAKVIAKNTAEMIAHWMRVGFVHGVMNTDNMSVHGLTIDYGPYGWLEDYNPGWTPNTTDSSHRRYRYGNQPQIGAWNLARFLEAISPIMERPERLKDVLQFYISSYEESNDSMWAAKLGISEFVDSDNVLISELNVLLQKVETDMTIFFRELCKIEQPDISELKFAFYDEEVIPVADWNLWLEKWWNRVDSNPDRELMCQSNPKYVLRNWMAQIAIDAAEKEDYSICDSLFDLLKSPYDEHEEQETEWYQKRPEWARHRVGCSMLSCSS